MDRQQQVLELVYDKGPVLPSDITETIKESTIIIGALLSGLVKEKKIKVSHAKVDGSPLYFIPSQRAGLARLRKHLNDKQQKFYDRLEGEGVLRDVDLTPVEKASARELRDFAVMLTVTIKGANETFWKWHLLSQPEAIQKIRDQLMPKKNPTTEPKQPPATVEAPQKEPEKDVEKTSPKKASSQRTLVADIDDKLFARVHQYLDKNDITILEAEVIRPGKELDLVITVPTPLCDLIYYAKVKDKKKSNDSDISLAYIQGQLRNLPAMYITTGELTKKATRQLDDDFRGIAVVEKLR